MSRELERRLVALERGRAGERIRCVVSDRPLSDDEWEAARGNGDYSEGDKISPILTEPEWVARHCTGGQHWSDCAVFNEPALPAGECNCGGLKPGRRGKP